ncbi:MAG: XRE family transcriptional regulator [Anaerolineae bacterium]
MPNIGKRLRRLRHDQGLTLAELGRQVGLSASYLSQIERDITMPSLSKLTAIARELGVGVGHFFEDDRSSVHVVKSNEGKRIERTKDTVMELMSGAPLDKSIQPCRVVCQPGASREQPPVHSGEGFCFVLEGQLTVTVGEETFVLDAGDSIHYQALEPHLWRNERDAECVFIWAVSPPIWETDTQDRPTQEGR